MKPPNLMCPGTLPSDTPFLWTRPLTALALELSGAAATKRHAATAILDRFLHHAEVIAITGRSYRLTDQAVKKQACETGEGNGQMTLGQPLLSGRF